MVETICNKITLRIRTKMPDINDERAEVINYGLQLLVGELPKTFIILLIAWVFRVLDLTLLAVIIVTPYRAVVGGAHFKTHLGCVLATSLFYIGNAILSKYIILGQTVQYILTCVAWIFAIVMISLYAPADTEDVPILRKKERKIKKILSYIIMSTMIILSLIIKDTVISNMFLFGTILQTIAISRLMYKIAGNRYGYEEYIKKENQIVT